MVGLSLTAPLAPLQSVLLHLPDIFKLNVRQGRPVGQSSGLKLVNVAPRILSVFSLSSTDAASCLLIVSFTPRFHSGTVTFAFGTFASSSQV